MEFYNYEKLVLEDYQRKRREGTLPGGLMHPTPANIRDECLRACRDRLLKKDERIIRDFFVDGSQSKTCKQIIESCEISKFKPLINYLNSNGTIKTKEKNIILLAWLIDFKDRPYEFGKKYGEALGTGEQKEADNQGIALDENSPAGVEESDVGDQGALPLVEEVRNATFSTTVAIQSEAKKHRLPRRRLFIISILLALFGSGFYGWWENRSFAAGQHCMYWAGDHYEVIPCNQRQGDKLIVALDTARLARFRKIMQHDTITRRSKGSIWYSKIDNNVEFFTADGTHPVKHERKLKPITDYIIERYAR